MGATETREVAQNPVEEPWLPAELVEGLVLPLPVVVWRGRPWLQALPLALLVLLVALLTAVCVAVRRMP